jgi:biopolymer transport protein ExbB
MFDLLQIVDSLTGSTTQAGSIVGKGDSVRFFDLIYMGGWIMVPLGLMLLLTVYFFAERTIAIRQAARIDDNFMNIIT